MGSSRRFRLTLGYVGLLAATLALFGAGTYLVVRTLLLNSADDALIYQSDVVAQAITLQNGLPQLRRDELPLSSPSDAYLIRLYAADGTIIRDPISERQHVPEMPSDVRTALSGARTFSQVRIGEEAIRLITLPLGGDAHPIGVLQIGLSLASSAKTLRIVLKALLLLMPVMLLCAGGGGLLLAHRALAPIVRITRTIQRINAEDLIGRIGIPASDDEVGQLADTFDSLLARLEAASLREQHFIANASHELRTPLAAIMVQIDVALAQPRSAESYRETLLSVLAQAQRLTQLASHLLFLARSETHSARVGIDPRSAVGSK